MVTSNLIHLMECFSNLFVCFTCSSEVESIESIWTPRKVTGRSFLEPEFRWIYSVCLSGKEPIQNI